MKTVKKLISSVSVIILIFSLIIKPYCDESQLEKVEASVWTSADQAISWVKSQLNNALDYDGVYGAQCVDLIKYYYKYLGVSPVTGNGCDYVTNSLPSGWQRIQGATPQKGDILVYTGGAGNYGHVAIYESKYSTYHQNYAYQQYVVNVTNVAYNGFSTPYWGVIRPNFASSEVVPNSVSLNKTSVILTTKGTTISLTATVTPSNATNKSVTWSSSNTSVATVNSNGVVTAVGNGTATITAKTASGAKTATCTVTVSIPTQNADGWYYTSVLPSNITTSAYEIQYQNIYEKYAAISPGSDWIDTGIDKKDETKVGGLYETDSPLTTSETVRLDSYYYYHWCGPNKGIQVNYYQDNNLGYIHWDGVSSDRAWEYASYQDNDNSAITYYHLKWSDNSDAYCLGNSTCDGTNGEHGNRSFYWYKKYVYQNYNVETLNLYRKTSAWTATKDATASSVKYRYRVLPTNVVLNKTTETITTSGATVSLTATITPSGANTAVTWKTSNASVATVNSNGVVTAVGNGTATITATTVSGGRTAKCTVTVNIIPTEISLNYTTASYRTAGATLQLKATVSPSNAANKNVTWKSSDTSVAVVDEKGLVTTVGNGTATITATTASGGKTAKCTVTVNIIPTEISLNYTTASYRTAGATLQLKATVSPSNAANKNVTWKSSDTSVAVVDEKGLVTTVGNGTASIIATTVSGSVTATCVVNVNIASTENKLQGMHKGSDGIWHYYSNGVIDTSYTGMAKNAYGWWYMKNGTLDRTYTGMAKNAYGWWYIKDGALDRTYTGMAKNAYGWWYMKDGKLDTTYTGMAKNAYGWWYMKNGTLDRTYTGMAKNAYGWWYMKNGKLDTTYTGVATNAYGTWYMKNGALHNSFTGSVTINGKVYNIKAGKVN